MKYTWICIILAVVLTLSAAGGSPAPERPASPEKGPDMKQITVSFGDHVYTATLEDNPSAEAFAALLAQGPVTVAAHDYGGFEKVGDLGAALPRSDQQLTTAPGDVILYQGTQITVYYAQNSWSLTRLARIDDPSGLREALGEGDVTITFRLAE